MTEVFQGNGNAHSGQELTSNALCAHLARAASSRPGGAAAASIAWLASALSMHCSSNACTLCRDSHTYGDFVRTASSAEHALCLTPRTWPKTNPATS